MKIQETFKNNKKFFYIVSTPIGNLNEINKRIICAINDSEVFFVESKNKFLKIINKFELNIKNKKIYVVNNANDNFVKFKFSEEFNYCFFSDAGYPLICDPGYKFILNLFNKSIFNFVTINCASPLLHLLTLTNYAHYPFYFAGFAPKSKNKYNSFLKELKNKKCNCIFYISKYKVKAFLQYLIDNEENNNNNETYLLTIGRELTKLNETIYYGFASELISKIIYNGEFCISMVWKK